MGGTKKRGNRHRRSQKREYNSYQKSQLEKCRSTISLINGMAAEDTILAALSGTCDGDPKWFLGAQHATGYEDLHKETDIVVQTRYGDVRIDVKLSNRYAQRTYKGDNVLTLVIPLRLEGRALRTHIFGEIEVHLKKTCYMFNVFNTIETSRVFFGSV